MEQIEIVVKYSINGRPHEEVFDSYKKLGEWYARNYRTAKAIYIGVKAK